MKTKFLDIFSCGFVFNFHNGPNKVNTFRRLLPQFLSCSASYLIAVNMGFVLAVSSIVVPSVVGISKHLNPDETLHMTHEDASWLASILFIVQPIGNVLSGFIVESLGRKGAILIINVIPAIAWILLPTAKTTYMVYIAFCLLGIWNGLTCSVSIYLGEISEASFRGILNAVCGISVTGGMFLIFLLGSFLSWRQVAYICAAVPILNILVAMFIPESPIWLVSKNRLESAQKSLQVLRGWVSSESISPELDQLKHINEMSSACADCVQSGSKCDHPPPTLFEKFKDIFQKRTMKPFLLVTILFVMMQFSGMFAMRPYIVPILNAHGIALDANVTTVILGVLGVLANVILIFTIRILGKRRIYLWSMVGNFVSCFGLKSLESIRHSVGHYNYFALAMFVTMQFCISVGVSSIPYFLMSEIFPFKSRTFCCGLAGIENQVFAFIAIKTYYNFESWLSLPGVICLYGVIAVVGFISMLFILPETENRTLEEIELHFSDNKRSIFDIKIKK
ncbi:facilitated trehalose transporter Tret1-like isoform X2 [Sitodiplosis mosellana]|uniref:facilitated trehalose transporter Tret1-like isoform X2 n=1 Tax=Sitodiplosis mosellana TaxID=263140 RepID=UPI0024440792|nr:facilitated trehalose transporter Tret1-like isoform X2 [Sitodiplosis mosellana]